MYEAFFGFHRRPFSTTPDVACCFLSEEHAALFVELSRCVNSRRGIAILTGEAGMGKTLLCEKLRSEWENRGRAIFLSNSQFETRRALLQAMLFELGQPYGGMSDQELRLELTSLLRQGVDRGLGHLLVLDEAHQLDTRIFEEIRLLSDLAKDNRPLLQVVLAGQPVLEEKLAEPVLAALNQRIACQVQLAPLSQSESEAYVEYRIRWAGGVCHKLFQPEALRLIAKACQGIPRNLNQCCDHALLLAYVADLEAVDTAIVSDALTDLQQLPLQWNTTGIVEKSFASISSPALSNDLPEENSFPDLDPDASFEFGGEAIPMAAPQPEPVNEVEVIARQADNQASPQVPIGDAYSSGSFEIPAPTKGSIRSLNLPSAALPEPAEEIVHDYYAAIDAGKTPPKKISVPAAPTVTPVRAVQKPSAPMPKTRTNPLPDLDLPVGRPQELIEHLLPLIEESQAEDQAEAETELIPASGMELINPHWKIPMIPAITVSSAGTVIVQDDLEQSIGNLVVEIGREFLQAGEKLPPSKLREERSATLRRTIDGLEKLTRFDIIEPETEPLARAKETRQTPIPKPNYQQLFTRLRRRQLKSDD